MGTRTPFMSHLAWLVLAVGVLAVVAVIAVASFQKHSLFHNDTRAVAMATEGGVDVQTTIALRPKRGGYDVVATVTIENTTGDPVPYMGAACHNPVTVDFTSTIPAPGSPRDSPPTAALRAHVMDYRRSLDGALTFMDDPAGQRWPDHACDEAGPPLLPVREKVVYTMSSPLVAGGVTFVDGPTTDVVTRLRLATLTPASLLQAAKTIEVRNPLGRISSATRQSAADYGETSLRFDSLMREGAVAAWIEAQDPSGWRAARLVSSYRTEGGWTLTAFHAAWALPLDVTGNDAGVVAARIPTEAVPHPPWTAATIPAGTTSAEKGVIPYRDIYVGDLLLPTGRVLVGDSVASGNMLEFDYGLPPGRYPVHIVTARYRYDEDFELVAWEELVLRRSVVTHWAAAIPVGHTARELKPGDVFTFGTDGASAGFASPEAMKLMDADLLSDSGDGPGGPLFKELGEREEANGWLWAFVVADPRLHANVFQTSTGSDGGFPVLVGLDAQNRPVILLSDFNALGMSYGSIHALPR